MLLAPETRNTTTINVIFAMYFMNILLGIFRSAVDDNAACFDEGSERDLIL